MLMHFACDDILKNRSIWIGTGWQDKLFLQLQKSLLLNTCRLIKVPIIFMQVTIYQKIWS